MKRTMIMAAAAAALFALSAPAPAQASIANPGLNQVAPANVLVQDAQYRRDRRYRRYYRQRAPRCWRQRVRIRVSRYRFVWKTVRRCEGQYRPGYRRRYR